MSKQIALLGAIKVLTDGFKDIQKSLKKGQSLVQKIEDFQDLIPDAIEVAKQGGISELKAEIEALQAADYVSLAGVLVSDLGVENDHAKAIIDASLKVLGDVASDLKPLIAAISNKPVEEPAPSKPAEEPSEPAPSA